MHQVDARDDIDHLAVGEGEDAGVAGQQQSVSLVEVDRRIGRFHPADRALPFDGRAEWNAIDGRKQRFADSEGCRSAFRTDVDHDSEVMPISVPN